MIASFSGSALWGSALWVSALLWPGALRIPSGTVTPRAEGLVLSESGRVTLPTGRLADSGSGAVIVVGDDLVLDFGGGSLRGASEETRPDAYAGVGVVVRGKNVTLENLRVSGYRVGVLAEGADGLVLRGLDVSDNFRQHLGSTPEREDSADWLWPHANDGGEWLARYGAGICVRDARGVRVEHCRARDGQNGLVLERVDDSVVAHCDFSFLSGWGIALWRSSRNVLARNALDFCVRGYSHGVYNRGQDSAGLLAFEQCSENLVALNSVTHGGDGFFGFAGHGALGEHEREADPEDFVRRGNNDNLFFGNDFSYAAAHGLELTFSFGNRIVANRFCENAICGIWGGYSQDTLVAHNRFERNGASGYGLERGGVAIEHGARNAVVQNTFVGNALGVRFWWDEDPGLMSLPWARANGGACEDNVVAANTFTGNATAFEEDGAERTVWRANAADGDASPDRGPESGAVPSLELEPVCAEVSERLGAAGLDAALDADSPVGLRPALAGRASIVMTEWGPWDHAQPFARKLPTEFGDRWEVLGVSEWRIARSADSVRPVSMPDGTLGVVPAPPAGSGSLPGAVAYEIELETSAGPLVLSGCAVTWTWHVRSFAWQTDPRESEDAWTAAQSGAVEFDANSLDLAFGAGGPSSIPAWPPGAPELAADRFGTVATTEIFLESADFELVVASDDGVRVWIDDVLVHDDWTWHAPREARIPIAHAGRVKIRIEHFELDGHAVLACRLRPVEPTGDQR